MYSASQVKGMVAGWKQAGIPKAELVVKYAEACMGWPYVWGAVGAECTPSKRQYYMGRSSIGEKDRENVAKNCPVLNGSKSACDGCQYYPNGQKVLINDCQGFVKTAMNQVGITLKGGGCTSMWNDNSNWSAKGKLDEMPKDKVCLVFIAEGTKMSHVGIHVGDGRVIHCSHYVREGKVPDKSWGWSHYAVPAGMDGTAPITLPTLRKGDSGEYVTLLQTKLIQRGYDLSPYGADGKFGNKTFEALKAFQKDNGLTVDGICGRNTYNALESCETTLYTVTISHVSKTVAEEILNKFGGTMTAE